ncbi:hypothetical protein M0R45_029452 [Rubus argutus]|uniref:Uncharacterized protein n=1 Tax=Rubus argutus TaxID=59490 RepID=A0AAW1W7R0_RUBAR
MMAAASSETTGWQSDLGWERRDQSELLISVEILSAVAWFCSVLRWVRRRFWWLVFGSTHSGHGQRFVGKRVVDDQVVAPASAAEVAVLPPRPTCSTRV